MRTGTLSAGDTAYLLRSKLGAFRQWGAYLNDWARGVKPTVAGITLTPAARVHDGMAYRPRFDLTEVLDFIEHVTLNEPEARPAKPKIEYYDIDKGKGWKLNKFDKNGAKMSRTIH